MIKPVRERDSTAYDRASDLDDGDRATLLEVARDSIDHGLAHGTYAVIDPSIHSARLRLVRGCFVTLHLEGELRGCVGSVRARGSLVSEVARVAFSAAFRDPRFPPVTIADARLAVIHISILSDPTPLACGSESELVALLRPGIDGVILSDGPRLGTFLPEVWERFPDPHQFLAQLRMKAGMPRDYWSPTLLVERYTTEAFG
jgi:uncharacterized protein